MKTFCFTIDDNIRFLRDLTRENPESLFDNPYLAMLKRLHDGYGVKIQLNLFYQASDFDLSTVSERYAPEWESCADWLKLSFHSLRESVNPYENSDYAELFSDCSAANAQILRFASGASLAKTTTLHYCLTTGEGVRALSDCGVFGLLGLFGTSDRPHSSYSLG